MRKALLLLAALVALLIPGVASAHTDYTNVTLDPEATLVSWTGATSLDCWQTTIINPGAWKYVIHNGGADRGWYVDESKVQTVGSRHWGLAMEDGAGHFHAPTYTEDTGYATRLWIGPYYTVLRSRRVYAGTEVAFSANVFVKFVNDGPSRVQIRANC